MKMDLPLSGSNETFLVEIETPLFNFYIKNNRKEERYTKLNEEDLAAYQVRCEEKCKIRIFNVGEWETEQINELALPKFFEQTPYEVIIENVSQKLLSFDHDSMLIRNKIVPVVKMGIIHTGVINFGNEIGMTELRVLVDGDIYLKIVLEIYPTKLSYKADYLQLREDIAKEIYNLAFDFMKRTYTPAALVYKENPSLTEFFSILREQFEALGKAVELMNRNPHHRLEQREEIKRYREGQMITPRGIQYINQHAGQVSRNGQRMIPHKVCVTYKQMTVDTYENQMIKHMIVQLTAKLKSVAKFYSKLRREEDQQVSRMIQKFYIELNQMIKNSFLKEVSSLDRMLQFSLVIQMAPVYRKFYKIYLILQKGLSISTDLFRISNKNVAELYEYWCFIKLGSLIRKKHKMIGNDFIKSNREGLYVSLRKGKASSMEFINGVTGERFTLAYNPRMQEGPTVVQKPDNVLTLKKEMQNVSYNYVLDAKYKLDYKKVNGKVLEVPKEEDINTMHRYRDAIVCQSRIFQYERSVFGGIILFPGTESELYRQSQFYESINKVNIGGLPFLPSQTRFVENFLDELIERTGYLEYEKMPMATGLNEYVDDLKIDQRDVLVGPLRDKMQLEGCLKYVLYYVPRKRIKDYNRTFNYIALYEHKEMGTLATGGIRYIGEVESAKVVFRKELIDLFPTNHSNLEEEYVVYKVKRWIKRREPILPNGYGVRTPWYTNHTLLKYAKTLPELHIKEVAEFKLILQLRRMMQDMETALTAEQEFVLKVGSIKIYMDQDQKIVVRTPEITKVFTSFELLHSPRKIYEQVMKYIM